MSADHQPEGSYPSPSPVTESDTESQMKTAISIAANSWDSFKT